MSDSLLSSAIWGLRGLLHGLPMTVRLEEVLSRTSSRLGAFKPIAGLPQIDVVFSFIAFRGSPVSRVRIAVSFGPASYSALWLPASVLLCALLRSRTEHWWLYLLGMFPIRMLGQPVDADFPMWLALFAISRSILQKRWGNAVTLHHLLRNPLRFETLRDFAIFVLVAVLLIPALSAVARTLLCGTGRRVLVGVGTVIGLSRL